MKSNIEVLLGEWGAWKRGENRSSLGYPSASAFATERVDHGGWGREEPNIPLVDDDVRRLDACISGLYPDCRAVVVAHYVWLGFAADKAEALGMRKRGFYDMLRAGHYQLSHMMGGKYSVGWEPQFSEIAASH